MGTLHIRAFVVSLDFGANTIVINGGPCRRYWENRALDWTPDALPLGFTFHELVLLQWRPDLNNQFLPSQIWPVCLRVISSSIQQDGLGILFPGKHAKVVLEGTGFDLIPPALAMVVNATFELGLR